MANTTRSDAVHRPMPRSRRSALWQCARRVAARSFVAVSVLYGTGITLFLVLKITVGERWALIGLFDSFLPLFLLPSLALLPVCALWRRWRLVALMTFAALTFGIGYGTTFVPRPPNTAAEGPATSILTYNVHSESQQFTAMIEVIRSANADIVALQELSPAAADLIMQELIRAYPYQALHPNVINPIWGQGVLSRYPIRSDEYWHISLGHQRVTIDVRGTQHPSDSSVLDSRGAAL